MASVRGGWGHFMVDTIGSGWFHSRPREATAEPASKGGGTSVKGHPRKGKPWHGSKEGVRNSPFNSQGEEEEQLQMLPWGDQEAEEQGIKAGS